MLVATNLRLNMMNGRPTRMKIYSDYTGLSIPPCGDFEESAQSTRGVIPPWLKTKTTNDNPNSLSLHDEIELFMEYMTPSPQEMVIRRDIVKRFTSLVESLNPDITVAPVGSYVTGLNLPTSDIDMVLKSRTRNTYDYETRFTLLQLYYKLRSSTFASKVDDVLQASVPLIRITDKKTEIEIDLTGEETHSIKATQAVEKWLNRHDDGIARVLIFVIKVFLSVRRCGTTYTGGINSYVLVWMVVAWVNLEWPKVKGPRLATVKHTMSNDGMLASIGGFDSLSLSTVQRSHMTALQNYSVQKTTTTTASGMLSPDFGEALKGFLKFYGSEFDYERQAISIEPTPRYTSKRYTTQPFLLSIYDPADSSIDMGSKAYGIKHVKESFKKAYRVLIEKRSSVNPGGLLGAMIGGDFTRYIEKRNILRVGK